MFGTNSEPELQNLCPYLSAVSGCRNADGSLAAKYANCGLVKPTLQGNVASKLLIGRFTSVSTPLFVKN